MSRHAELALFSALQAAFQTDWDDRGYQLSEAAEGYSITGDSRQFYMDAVAADAEAHLAMEFLRLHAFEEYDAFRDMALDDGIDLDDSQQIFLRHRSLQEVLRMKGKGV